MEYFIRIFESFKLPLFTLLGTVLGAYSVYRYGLKKLQIEKRLEFIERQIMEFYSPLVGLITDIFAKNELRIKISKASDEEWRKIFDGVTPVVYQHFRNNSNIKKFDKIIEYDNEELRKHIIPSYKKMLEIFREKIWLAEPETREWYKEFSEYIGIWDRSLYESLPAEIRLSIGHAGEKGDKLDPFFENLRMTLDFLREKLGKGKP